MKIKLTASCTWNTNNRLDEELALRLLEDPPAEIILDYLEDALRGAKDMSNFEVSTEQIGK